MTELTPEVIARIDAILSGKPLRRAASVIELKYFYVEWKGFGTVISSKDCQSIESAFELVAHDKLQAWYVIPNSLDLEYRVIEWNHDQYCDWLRSKS